MDNNQIANHQFFAQRQVLLDENDVDDSLTHPVQPPSSGQHSDSSALWRHRRPDDDMALIGVSPDPFYGPWAAKDDRFLRCSDEGAVYYELGSPPPRPSRSELGAWKRGLRRRKPLPSPILLADRNDSLFGSKREASEVSRRQPSVKEAELPKQPGAGKNTVGEGLRDPKPLQAVMYERKPKPLPANLQQDSDIEVAAGYQVLQGSATAPVGNRNLGGVNDQPPQKRYGAFQRVALHRRAKSA